MKNLSENKLFTTLLYLLSIALIAKLIWLGISIVFLPKEGVEHIEVSKLKPLYYRTKLARKVKVVKKPKKVIKKAPQEINSMRGMRLLGIYNSGDIIVVTIKKGTKTYVIEKGENIDGFVLTSAIDDYAIFTKNGKEFKLKLESKSYKNYIKPIKSKKNIQKKKKETITGDETQKTVPRGLLTSYTKNIDKVWKDIGIGEYRENGVLKGFKVNFVKRGSDFEKLGLKKGDVLKAINGEELNSYNSAFSFYKEINNIDNLTLSIERNNQEMELEYEIE